MCAPCFGFNPLGSILRGFNAPDTNFGLARVILDLIRVRIAIQLAVKGVRVVFKFRRQMGNYCNINSYY